MGTVTVHTLTPPGITITGGGGADILSGTAGADTINGGDGADQLYGQDDALYGGEGNDILVATGSAYEEGGGGNDIYALQFGNSNVRIGDFVPGVSGERIRLYGSATSYQAVQDGADTKITFTDGVNYSTLTLLGVTASALTANNIQLGYGDRLLPAAPDYLEPTDLGLSTVTVSGDFTVAQGESLHFNRFAYNIFSGVNALTFTNNGAVSVTQGYDGLAALMQDGASGGAVINSATGQILVESHADGDTASGIVAPYASVTNAGAITIVSLHGSASGLSGAVTNSGTLTVWAEQTATGVGAAGGHLFSNTGTITVTGHVAVGVSFYSDPAFNNSGAITVADDTAALDSIAVKIAAFHDATYTNSGTLRGDYAFWVDESRYSPSPASRETILNSGQIYGDTDLALGNDTVINTGGIYGNVRLGAGNDTFDGRGGGQSKGAIYGGAGGDTLMSGNGEALFGGDGADIITGGGGGDLIDGGSGADTLDGGGGQDILSYLDSGAAASVDLATGVAVADGTDSVQNFEIVFGSAFGDTLRGAAGAESLYGGAGADILDGRDGADILVGDTGDDTETGGAGDDTFVFRVGDGHDVITDFAVGGAEDHLALYIFTAYTVQQVGADTLVTYSANDSVLLKNVQASSLTTADILTPFGEAPAVSNFLRSYGLTAADIPAGPNGSETVIADGDYTVYAGQPITFGALPLAFKETSQDDLTPTFTNLGAFSITNGGTVTGVLGDPYSPNRAYVITNAAGASIAVHDTGSGQATGVTTYGTLSNAGQIAVTSTDVAYGVALEAGVFTNTGQLTVQGAHYAVGLAADNGGTFSNSGSIDVTGGATVIGIDYFRGSITNSFTNSGAIHATSTGGQSMALRIVADFYMTQHFANSGTLQGDYAIKVDDTSSTPTSTSSEIIDNTGTLAGKVYLGLGDDQVHNTGQITGQVDLGGGNDLYDGWGGTESAGVLGGAGDDHFIGSAGADSFDGGSGLDTIDYTPVGSAVQVNLTLAGAQATGGGGADTLTAIENIIGSAFDDTLTGTGGDNVMEGGAGNDSLTAGGGGDTASYAGAAAGVTVSLAVAGAQNTGGAGTDTLSGFENLLGSAFGDSLTGDGGANILTGGAGADTLTGAGGDDLLLGGLGNDGLDGGAGVDTVSYADITGGGVTVSLAVAGAQNTGAAGLDTLTGVENLIGSAGADTLTGDAAANVIDGGDGSDTLYGGAGDDTLYGGATGMDALYGGGGNDLMSGGAGLNAYYGGDGHDVVSVNANASSASVTLMAGRVWSVAISGGNGFTVTGVETLHFNDRDIQLHPLRDDFNLDGKSDVLWRNNDGELYVWNSQQGQGAFLGQSLGNPGLGWHVQDTGDFNGDGKADILWRNDAGDLYVYKSNAGPGVSFTGQSIPHVDPVWAVVGQAGDFNGDGRDDILFRNTATGEAYVWNSQPSGAAVNFLGATVGYADPGYWAIQGVGDLNGDGRADVLWRSDDGDVYLFVSDNGGPSSRHGQSVSSVGNDWTILGLGDFNGDGRDDVLWRHAGDGELYVWNSQMGSSDVNFLGQSLGAVGLDWSVAAIGDYDGDGRADVLFRNTDGRVYVWNSNDTGPVGFQGQGLGTTPTDWHILSDFHGM
jgi:Ca2+-binding RTX toxin-like protein